MSFLLKSFLIVILFQLPVQINNTLHLQQTLYKAKGTASYYAHKFNNRKTASGEIFKNDSLTAAHKTLHFGTIVKVTNLSNDSVVYVRINDRLPKKSSRIIDLSKAAAKKLNFISKGLTQVFIEQVNN